MKTIVAMTLALLGTTQEVDNPQFKYWSGCKPGSWVKMKMEMEFSGKKSESETMHKLLEIKDGIAVIEITGKTKVAGQEHAMPAQKQEIKAKESADKIKIDKEGDEEIEVAGKKLKCHWYELTSKNVDKESKSKVWLSMDIPGGMAKASMGLPSSDKPIVMTAIEWEKK